MAPRTVWRTGIGVGLFVLTMLSASAAEPFIEISTSGIEVDGMQRQRHRGVEVDWVRRVHLNPAALQAQDISVDLYDMTLLLIRDTRDPSARSAGEWLYETDERGSPKREMREPTGSVWTGTVHQREGAAAAAGVHGARVEIWESARGFSAEFGFGKMRYELIGDVLIKRDMRRFRVNENNDVRDIRPDRPRPPRGTNADGEPEGDAEHVIRVVSEHTFAHEMGHLLGADHNTENVTLDPPKFDYGHGYRAGMHIAPRWRTVMAQECQDTVCDRENLWSSPLIHHNGQPAGTVGVHDNARVLRETKAIIAAFYPDPLQ